ncbi:hypothetical protein FG93_01117 [Bosea sp. LC85]|uniref:hypothetical protein n=1 Tax=Bosea sp. LC85 TaxID=1502851 RepID=UPI0004E3B1E4|nr:hypothetical protein [Bosea sp. LC85]KFC74531.1 hypothetical protein FG93_01117 [Bosea sp. LC85]
MTNSVTGALCVVNLIAVQYYWKTTFGEFSFVAGLSVVALTNLAVQAASRRLRR